MWMMNAAVCLTVAAVLLVKPANKEDVKALVVTISLAVRADMQHVIGIVASHIVVGPPMLRATLLKHVTSII